MIPKSINFLKETPLLVCAPMVDQSELPFRLLCRRYGSNLCYTPMLHSRMMVTHKKYKQQHFSTCELDRPLVAQLCGDDPDILLQAAQMLEEEVDAIDLNFGCPQGIARRGHYGSYLLGEPDLIERIVKHLSTHLKVPLFCKIRILKDEQKTIDLVNRMVKAGCSLLTVHGRTKEQNKEAVGECDWKIIKKIKEMVDIPVVANGGIYTYQDVKKCLNQTGVDGVMSAQSLLENPALFSGQVHDLDKLANEYLEIATEYKADASAMKAHLFKMLYTGLQQHTDLREKLTKCSKLQQFKEVARELQERRKEVKKEDKFGWYYRYRKAEWEALKNPQLPAPAADNPVDDGKKENTNTQQAKHQEAVAN